MSWSRFDDRYAQHPKMVALGDFYEVGLALDVAAVGWCNLNDTEGVVPKPQVPRLIRCHGMRLGAVKVTPERVAAELVRVGRWHDDGDTYRIHDFLEYNLSREQKAARSAARAAAGANGGKRSGETRRSKVRAEVKQVASPFASPSLHVGFDAVEANSNPGPVPGSRTPEDLSTTARARAWEGLLPFDIPEFGALFGDPPMLPAELADAYARMRCDDPVLGVRGWHAKRAAQRGTREGRRTNWLQDAIGWALDHESRGCPCQKRSAGPLRAVPGSKTAGNVEAARAFAAKGAS